MFQYGDRRGGGELDPETDLELDPNLPPAKSEHLAEFLWNAHSKTVEHLKRGYDLEDPANRDLRRELKYHGGQCEILTSLAKLRDERGPPETWTSHAQNTWMRNAWAACEAWADASSGLYKRLEDTQPLVQKLTKLQEKLEIWAKIDPMPSPMREIPEKVSTSEQISTSTQVATPSRTPTIRLMYETGACLRDGVQGTPYLTDDLRRLFNPSNDGASVS